MEDFKLSRDDSNINNEETNFNKEKDFEKDTNFNSGFDGSSFDDDGFDKNNFDKDNKSAHKKEKFKSATPANPIFLTKRKLAVILVLVIALAFGGAFGGFWLYDNIFPSGASKKGGGSVNGDGYTLEAATGSAKTVEEIVSENLEAVVEIRTESVQAKDPWLNQYVTEGAGSGVIIKEDGYIITNNHVIDGASKIYVTLSNEKEYAASLVGTDAETDIAILKIDANKLPVATYGNSEDLAVGDLAVVIGNPLGELGGTVTSGIISSLNRDVTIGGQPMNLLQTDASVNPGNSGGGLFDQYGHLVGIVVAKSSGSDVEGLGFAIPINKAADIASQIMKNGKATSTTAYSGMTYAQGQNGSVYIQEVNEAFAQKAGFKQGDRVISIDDNVISDLNTLSAVIKKHKKGDEVNFTIDRQGKQMNIKLKLQTKE